MRCHTISQTFASCGGKTTSMVKLQFENQFHPAHCNYKKIPSRCWPTSLIGTSTRTEELRWVKSGSVVSCILLSPSADPPTPFRMTGRCRSFPFWTACTSLPRLPQKSSVHPRDMWPTFQGAQNAGPNQTSILLLSHPLQYWHANILEQVRFMLKFNCCLRMLAKHCCFLMKFYFEE